MTGLQGCRRYVAHASPRAGLTPHPACAAEAVSSIHVTPNIHPDIPIHDYVIRQTISGSKRGLVLLVSPFDEKLHQHISRELAGDVGLVKRDTS